MRYCYITRIRYMRYSERYEVMETANLFLLTTCTACLKASSRSQPSERPTVMFCRLARDGLVRRRWLRQATTPAALVARGRECLAADCTSTAGGPVQTFTVTDEEIVLDADFGFYKHSCGGSGCCNFRGGTSTQSTGR